jgi:transposase
MAVALYLQQVQSLRQLKRKSEQLAFYSGNKDDLQETLALIESLSKDFKRTEAAMMAAIADDAKDAKDKKQDRAKTWPTEQLKLPHVPASFELDPADRVCRSCGGELFAMEGQFETSEMIDVVDISYRVVQVKQQKYVCRCGGCVETAPGPDRALPGSRYSLAFAIKVVLDKYLDHIPLERQVRILGRHGLVITSQTLWDMAWAIAQRLSLVDAALEAHVKMQPVIGLDQTSWPKLEQGASKPWQMWCLWLTSGACAIRLLRL